MRVREFVTESWTGRSVKNYFASQGQPAITRQDFRIQRPMPGCLLFQFRTVPDLARSFFRMAEHNDGPGKIDLTKFLDRFLTRSGDVPYFKFWDGFNITDRSLAKWLLTTKDLTQAEQVLVRAIKRYPAKDRRAIVGIAGNSASTRRHELFHACYYLDSQFRRQVNQAMRQFRQTRDYQRMTKILRDKLHYHQHVDEEIAAYLADGSDLGMVFGFQSGHADIFRSLMDQIT